jgi:hypothetical protein
VAAPLSLYRPSEHERLSGPPWDEARVRGAIRAIVADAEAAADEAGRWPWHPRDGEEDAATTVYAGSAGVIWALDLLGSTGWDDAALAALERYRATPDGGEYASSTSYWLGECGAALVAFRLRPDEAVADRIHELVLANLAHESNEPMWGTPGSMLAAEAMLAWTGEGRWADAWAESAESVLAAQDDDGLWTQTLYGSVRRHLGPAHGFAGNVRALANRQAVAVERVDEALAPWALREGPLVNWPPTTTEPPNRIRVQWCHGAPGIVASIGELIDERLAVAGGELTWRAGPLAKGPGLCHGTAGNGYAFLRLHRRTGDARWLDRARAFAMHAIEQVEAERRALGRGRYSLFTGDVGVALYLSDLLEGRDGFPTLGPFA